MISYQPKYVFEFIGEAGYDQALYGISKSFSITDRFSWSRFGEEPHYAAMVARARKLAHAGLGHNGFLKLIDTWWEITVSRDAWQQFNTYHVGVVDVDDAPMLSESTMHTILKSTLTQSDFAIPVRESYLEYLNDLITAASQLEDQIDRDDILKRLKKDLPESFLQTRVLKLSYLALQNIVKQREHHKMNEWKAFVSAIQTFVKHPEFIIKDKP